MFSLPAALVAPDRLAVDASDARIRRSVQLAAVVQESPKPEPVTTPTAPSAALGPMVIDKPLRSGQQVYAKGRDLIVLAIVNAGAEVIADGNIHIYGSLRGKAIAGASGDSSKRIYCYNMQAELVSIAGNYWLSHSLQGEFWGKPACIRWQGESLVISELV